MRLTQARVTRRATAEFIALTDLLYVVPILQAALAMNAAPVSTDRNSGSTKFAVFLPSLGSSSVDVETTVGE